MKQDILPIRLSLPLKLGSVNCCLVKAGPIFILIDTGSSNRRTELEQALENAGCRPGNLSLIVITHGDFDHTGNAAYLQKKFATHIGMHVGDLDMVKHGDMLANRKSTHIPNRIAAFLTPRLMGFDESKRFTPNFFLEDGDKLAKYGFDAEIVWLPGHSHGSIGVLTADGELFCGDLFENRAKPTLNTIMDDPDTSQSSLQKLESYHIEQVYPGHGQPFPMRALQKNE